MSDRQRRYVARRREGLRCYHLILDEVAAEEFVASFGLAADMDLGAAQVFELLIELDGLMTRNNASLANVLKLLLEELRPYDEDD